MDKKQIILFGAVAAGVIALIMFNILNSDNLSFHQIDDMIKEGNGYFDKKQYQNALKEYNQVLLNDTSNAGATYNLANTDFKRGKYEEADSVYDRAANHYLNQNIEKKEIVDDEMLAQIYHNKGNANMKQTMPIDSVLMFKEMMESAQEGEQPAALKEAYPTLAKSWGKAQQSIIDYKNSLRRAPSNDSTRFNLALAQDYEKNIREILQNMPPPPQNQQNQQNQQDKKDQQDQQDQQEQKDQQNQQSDPNDERKETDEKNGQKDDQIPDLSKENAEQILKAMEKDEENTLKKMKLQRNQNQQRRHIEKNW